MLSSRLRTLTIYSTSVTLDESKVSTHTLKTMTAARFRGLGAARTGHRLYIINAFLAFWRTGKNRFVTRLLSSSEIKKKINEKPYCSGMRIFACVSSASTFYVHELKSRKPRTASYLRNRPGFARVSLHLFSDRTHVLCSACPRRLTVEIWPPPDT